MARVIRALIVIAAVSVIITLIALGAGGPVATAAPLQYQESVSGDLPTLASDITLALDPGINTVAGSSSAATDFVTSFVDADSFSFTVPSGDVVTSISYAFTVTSFSGGAIIISFGLDGVGSDGVTFPDDTSPLSLFATQLPLGEGSHTQQQCCTIFVALAPSVTWDYTWTFDVGPAPVPEPSSLLLLASGLAGFGLVRKARGRR